ncbi:MAG: hypothetical protein DWP95_12915 [Proteobacteria bacterium]|nr:MAG: hypothetical protein DWP95_12915 [Pseudomonadota bacterium]
MKHILFKLCIIGGLLVTGVGFSQNALQDELMLKSGESFPNNSWRSKFKDNPDDPDYLATKTYGEPSGNYGVYLPASGTSPYSKSMTSIYGGAGCIYRNSPSGFYDLQLQLPDGHEIHGFRYYFYDSSAASSTAYLYTVDNSGIFSSELTIVSTGDTGYGSVYAGLPTTTLVDNYNYTYSIRFYSGETGGNQEICGVRLFMDSTP